MPSKLPSFMAELKRRKVYHVAVAYVVVGFGVASGAQYIFEMMGFELAAAQFVAVLVILGFPIALVLAWAYEVRPENPRPSELPAEGLSPTPEPAPLAPITKVKERKSIVVLPFDNMSPDPRDTYFCEGLTEEIITHLSYLHSLRVISRNSAMVLKGTQKSTRAIAEELDVQYVLEGSVRKAGENLRITAQLIDATSDEHIWAEKYDGVLDDVFDLQEQVSRSIVESLELSVSPDETRRLTERSIDSVQVYECFLKSREEWSKFTEEGLERALQIIQNGINVFGESESLYVGLGTIYAQYIHFGAQKDESYLGKAEDCIEKVFSLNPESTRGHHLKGFTHWWRGEQRDAVRHLKRALVLNPTDSDSLAWLGWMYAISGKGFAAYPLFQKALEVDPLNASLYGFSSGCQSLDGDFRGAVETASKGFQMEHENPWFRVYQAFILAYDQRNDQAQEVLDLLIRDTPGSHWGQLGLFLRHALRGDVPRALESVTSELRAAMEWNEYYPLLMADCFAMIDEKEKAIDWLEEAVKGGCIHYPFLSEHDPFLEEIRGEDRFGALIQNVRQKWESFET